MSVFWAHGLLGNSDLLTGTISIHREDVSVCFISIVVMRGSVPARLSRCNHPPSPHHTHSSHLGSRSSQATAGILQLLCRCSARQRPPHCLSTDLMIGPLIAKALPCRWKQLYNSWFSRIPLPDDNSCSMPTTLYPSLPPAC